MEPDSLGYAICQPSVSAANQIYDLAMTIGCNIMRGLCGKNWAPSAVSLSRRPPPALEPYQRTFRAPLRFDADQSALMFKTSLLEYRPGSADPLLFRHLEKAATQLHVQQSVTTTDRLRQMLRRSLASGKYTNTECARQLCIHERTLHRRLEEEGTSFRQVLEDLRYDMARQLLAETEMGLADISRALGYADASTFVRSFKRWSAVTPAQWRSGKGHRENPGSLSDYR